MKSWKTTVTGICAIVAALAKAGSDLAAGHPIDYSVVVSAIMVGVGLICAKDSNVTGGTTPQ